MIWQTCAPSLRTDDTAVRVYVEPRIAELTVVPDRVRGAVVAHASLFDGIIVARSASTIATASLI